MQDQTNSTHLIPEQFIMENLAHNKNKFFKSKCKEVRRAQLQQLELTA